MTPEEQEQQWSEALRSVPTQTAEPEKQEAPVSDEGKEAQWQSQLVGSMFSGSDKERGIVPKEVIEEQKAKAAYQSKLPKTWFGEFTNAFARGTDSAQEMLWGAGALGADYLGWEGGKKYMLDKVAINELEALEHPSTVPSYDQVDNFDEGMRYFLGLMGQGAPQLVESIGAGVIGAAIASPAAPGVGTIAGGAGGFFGKKVLKNILKGKVDDLVKAELKQLAKGAIQHGALSAAAKTVFRNEASSLAKKYGAVTLLGVNAWAQESGSIYTDLLHNKNVTESDRRFAALAGGLVAAIPDVAFQGWIASKFFPGLKTVPQGQMDAAQGFLARWFKTYGKELLKVAPAEGGQEFVQTVVEQAAKDWAEFGAGKAMERIFSPTPEQFRERIDSAFGGAALGVLSAGISTVGELRAHPNPEVRQRERDLKTRVNDIAPEVNVTDADAQLASIQEQRGAIEEEIELATDEATKKALTDKVAALQKQEQEIQKGMGLVTAERVTRNGVDGTITDGVFVPDSLPPVVEPAKLKPLEKAKQDILKLMVNDKQETGKGYAVATEEQKTEKSAEIDAIVNEIAPGEQGAAYRDAITSGLKETGMLNILASEGVGVVTHAKAKDARIRNNTDLMVATNTDGTIELILPTFDNLAAGVTPEAKQAYIANLNNILAHEIIHVAHAVALRNEFNASEALKKEHGNLGVYTAVKDKELADSLRAWWDGMSIEERGRMPDVARQLMDVYNPAEPGAKANDGQISGEIVRMAVELARLGKLSETTEAFSRAVLESQSADQKQRATTWLTKWIEALKRIHKTLARLLDPKTSTPEFVDMFNQINDVLDKYGTLVNEKAVENKPKKPKAPRTPDPRDDKELERIADIAETGRSKVMPKRKLLVQDTAEYRKQVAALTDEELDSAEAKVIKKIQKMDEQGVSTEVSQPFVDLYDDIQKLREIKAVEEQRVLDNRVKAIEQMEQEESQQTEETEPELQEETQQPEAEIQQRQEPEPARVEEKQEPAKSKKLARPYDAYRVALKAAKNDPSRLPQAMRAHYEWRKAKMTIDEAARDFKEAFGRRATLAAYKRAVVNETREDVSDIEVTGTAEPKAAPVKFTPDRQKIIDRMTAEVVDFSRKVVENIPTGRSVIKERGGRLNQGGLNEDDFSPARLEYATAPHSETASKAHNLVESRGFWNVVDILDRQVMGDELNIREDTGDPMLGPNPVLKAVYEIITTGLSSLSQQMKDNQRFRKAEKTVVNELFLKLDHQMARLGTGGGQYNSFTGVFVQFWNGLKALAAYVEPILEHASVIFGKNKGKPAVAALRGQLNELMAQYYGGKRSIMSKPKLVAALRQMLKDVHTRKWQGKFREQIARDAKKAKTIAKRASARLAEHQGFDEEGPAYVEKVIQAIIADMVGPTRDPGAPSELEVFRGVIAKIGRENARDLGLAPENPARPNPSIEERFAAVLKNDTLYAQFANGLRDAYIEKYGGVNPSQEFLDSADTLHSRLANRWTPGMVDQLVREKVRQHEERFSKIVQGQYSDGFVVKEKIRAAVAEYLVEEGVTNVDLIDALVNDISDSFDEQMSAAREKFFGSTKGINAAMSYLHNLDPIGYMQKTIQGLAKEHASATENLEEGFEHYLFNELGIPEYYAVPLAKLMQAELNDKLNGYTDANGKYHKGLREKQIEKWLAAQNLPERVKARVATATERIIQAANAGLMTNEKAYNALASKFGLPPYNSEVAKQVYDIGEEISDAPDTRTKEGLKSQLSSLIQSQVGIKPTDVYISALYVNMLSGPSTQLVNILANTTSLVGHFLTQSIKHPFRIGKMLRALVRSVTGIGQIEMRETWATGLMLGKYQEKYFHSLNPFELADPVFKSKYKNQTLAKIDEGFAKFVHTIYRGVRAKYVSRALGAMDILFYKMAQEMSVSAKLGDEALGTPEDWESAMSDARDEMERQGRDPDNNREDYRKMMLIAHDRFNEMRFVNETQKQAWHEAGVEALGATFQGEPKGWIGAIANAADKFTRDRPIGKMVVPFTRVVANVMNRMLEWTPYGYARYFLSEDFKIDDVVNGEKTKRKDFDIALRATMGTAMIIALMTRLAEEDDDNPEFTIYADGPRDLETKRQMMSRGWRPFTLKFGDHYFSYLYTPVGMGLALVGGMMDDYRDGRINKPSVTNMSFTSMASAMLRVTTEQSFLAGIADIVKATDSPDPVGKLSKFFARTTSTFVMPNLVKQLDKWINPTVQEANTLWESFIKEIPVARSFNLKTSLNVFGEEVKRTPGPFDFPGTERFVTTDPGTDPVFNLLGEKRIKVPGFSKTTKFKGEKMTPDLLHEYVKIAGPKIKAAIGAEIQAIKAMDREDAQDYINNLAASIKSDVKAQLERNR